MQLVYGKNRIVGEEKNFTIQRLNVSKVSGEPYWTSVYWYTNLEHALEQFFIDGIVAKDTDGTKDDLIAKLSEVQTEIIAAVKEAKLFDKV